MGPKKNSKPPEDVLQCVIMIDENLSGKATGKEILKQLQDDYAGKSEISVGGRKKSFRVECSIEGLEIKNSIHWITKVSNENVWQTEEIVFVLVGINSFVTMFKNMPNLNVQTFLVEVLGKIPNPDVERIQIYLMKETKKSSQFDDKVLEAEMKRIIDRKALELASECLVSYGTNLHLDLLDNSKVASLVSRATKSVLELLEHRNSSTYISGFHEEGNGSGASVWYPGKSESVSVNKNKVGLTNLWQRYLMEISKNVGVEKVKVITNDKNFSTIQRATETYANCVDDKIASNLLSEKATRPSGSTQNNLALNQSGPKIGEITSRKIHRALTSLDGNETLEDLMNKKKTKR